MALLGRESLPEPGKRRLYTDYWEESLCRNPENGDSIPTTTLQQRRLHNGDGSTGKRVFAGTRKTATLYRRRLCSSDDSTTAMALLGPPMTTLLHR
jgi:hypothetical protein